LPVPDLETWHAHMGWLLAVTQGTRPTWPQAPVTDEKIRALKLLAPTVLAQCCLGAAPAV